MKIEIPRLEDYQISPNTGFLPDKLPLSRLPDPYYAPWENIVQNLPGLLLTKRVRMMVDQMPVLSIDKLRTIEEWRRAYSVLGFLGHAYVWGGSKENEGPADHLPNQLAKPWIITAKYLELPPIATYAGLILWNFTTLFPTDNKEWDLDVLGTNITYTGSIDERWFYLVSVAFERASAPCLTTGLDAIRACREDNASKVITNLQKLAEAIDYLITLLGRMEEQCDPHVFYFRMRPFLAGWKNMAESGLPHGVRYGDETEYREFSGGSNAQSSIIQALDILLGVEHYPTGDRKKPEDPQNQEGIKTGESNNFLLHMRDYMPGPHRNFLSHLSMVSNIREYVISHQGENKDLALAYDACVAMLKAFRDRHIQIVTRYIILQARKAEKGGSALKRQGLALANDKSERRGTGGTALIPFLKQARDETGDSAAGNWGRRILSDNITNNLMEDNNDGGNNVGLAGKWTMKNTKNLPHW